MQENNIVRNKKIVEEADSQTIQQNELVEAIETKLRKVMDFKEFIY